MEFKSVEYFCAVFDTPASRGIIKLLESNGLKFLRLPNLETETSAMDASQKAKIGRLTDFDWIIFPDVLAVDHFVEILTGSGVDLFDLDQLNVMATGQAIADRLRHSELHADLITGSTENESTFRELLNYLGDAGPEGANILVPHGEADRIEIVLRLKSAAANVFELPVYRIIPAKAPEAARFKALLFGGAIDEIIFSGPTDFIALKQYFQDVQVNEILSDVRIAATDKQTLDFLSEAGLTARIFRPPS